MTNLTPGVVEALIDKVSYYHPSICPTLTICILKLKTGGVVTGESNVIDPTNFDEDIGRGIARKKAVDRIWELEGYALKREITQASAGI